MRGGATRCAAGAAIAFAAATALAGTFPEKPVTIYVGFAAGGGTDLSARSVAALARPYLGQPVVVVNMPGASGTLAARKVAQSRPDGYTLLMAGGSETVSVGNFKPLPYHPIDDFVPVIRMTRERIVFIVKAEAPWKSVADFVENARAHPGKFKYASSGHGGIFHATMLAFCRRTGIRLTHVPYKGGAESMAALLGGHIDLALASPMDVTPLMKAGTVRCLAITSLERTSLLPDVPTLKELGYDLYIENQKGLVAPAGTPPERVQILHDALKKLFDDPEFIRLTDNQRLERGYLSGPDFAVSLRQMYDQIGSVVRRKEAAP